VCFRTSHLLDETAPLNSFGPHTVRVKLGSEEEASTGTVKIVITERKLGIDRSRLIE
jgi:hypothetical protein